MYLFSQGNIWPFFRCFFSSTSQWLLICLCFLFRLIKIVHNSSFNNMYISVCAVHMIYQTTTSPYSFIHCSVEINTQMLIFMLKYESRNLSIEHGTSMWECKYQKKSKNSKDYDGISGRPCE